LISITNYRGWIVIASSFFLLPFFAFAYTSPGKPTGFVNDFAGLLSVEQKQNLEGELDVFKKDTTTEISVVTIRTLGGDDIESYTNSLFREYGVGEKDKNNGVLFLVAVDDKQMRIEVGYGLEGALTDTETRDIQENIVKPYFKDGNYEAGIVGGTRGIMEAVRSEFTAPANSQSTTGISFESVSPFLFVFGIFIIQVLFGILAPTKSWWLGGVLGGGIGVVIGLFFTSLLVGALSAGALALLGLFFDFLVSKSYQSQGKSRRDFWTSGGLGGWGGGRRGGGTGFGGFGGGSSGGGGSSSSW